MWRNITLAKLYKHSIINVLVATINGMKTKYSIILQNDGM